MLIEQISIFMENKPGRLADVTELLAKSGVDIRAMSIADTRDFGILRLIVNKPALAEEVLKREGYTFSPTKVIAIGLDDQPGGLAGVLRLLYDNGISVEYMYAFVSRVEGKAYVILRVQDNDRAIAAVEKAGLTFLTDEALYGM